MDFPVKSDECQGKCSDWPDVIGRCWLKHSKETYGKKRKKDVQKKIQKKVQRKVQKKVQRKVQEVTDGRMTGKSRMQEGRKGMMGENPFRRQGAMLLAQSDGCSVWQFRNETGDGTMTTYQVFPGVMLSFNDFHMERYDCVYQADRELLAIDHCREGRMEYPAGDHALAYIGEGDMKLDRRKFHTGGFDFPSGHYHGLTVAFDLEILATEWEQDFEKDLQVHPREVISRFHLEKEPLVIHGAQQMEHIFAQMYQVPETIRIPYFKVKILEMLLYLKVMELPQEMEKPYFYRTQVEKVKAIRVFLTENLSENFTQEELSRRFDLPLTPMKNCFKSVYGSSMGVWLTRYRMHEAARMLVQEEKPTIARIGGAVGYDSASKFTSAFKKVMGVTPSEYRMQKGKIK